MGFGVLGINHHLAPVSLRSALAEIANRRFRSESEGSLILLSTCNRIEIYFSSPTLSSTHAHLLEILRKECSLPFDQLLYTFFGKACMRHLIRVTAGLDSALLGETEIQGQVKKSYLEAADHQELPFDLHFLFQKALHTAKKIRSRHLQQGTQTTLARGVEILLEAHLPPGTPLLLVGASETNRRIALHLGRKKQYPLSICNRSIENGIELSLSLQCALTPWKAWNEAKALIFATSSPMPLLDPEDTFLRDGRDRLLIDLGVPQNVDPRLRDLPSITLFDIDEVQKTAKTEARNHIETGEIFLQADALYQNYELKKAHSAQKINH